MSTLTAIVSNPSNGLIDEFGNGLIANYAAELFNVPPDLASQPQSQWYIAQWGQPTPINPDSYIVDDPLINDPLYGNASYAWSAAEGNSSITIFSNTAELGGGNVVELTDGSTLLPASSGGTDEADMFLASPAISGAFLSHPVTLSLDAKLIQSLVSYASPSLAAQFGQSGLVFGTFDIGIAVNFNGTDGLPRYSGFIQIVPWSSNSAAPSNYSSGPIMPGSTAQFVTSVLMQGDPSLSLLPADAGALPTNLSYNINEYVYQALLEAYSNFSVTDKSDLFNLANWSIGGIYLGPATNNLPVAQSLSSSGFAANESIGLQVSDVSVVSDTSTIYNPQITTSSTTAVDSNPTIPFYDNTVGATGLADGSTVSGSLNGITDKYIYNGADQITLTAPVTGNWEFGGGSGPTTLIAVSGNNKLIASTGGSTMTSGTGNDTFEIPDGSLIVSNVTDVIFNFHPGDSILLDGLASQDWTKIWTSTFDPQGTSLTLTATDTSYPSHSEVFILKDIQTSAIDAIIATMQPGSSGLNIQYSPGL